MTNQEVLDFIAKLTVVKFQLKKYLKNHHPDVYRHLVDATSFLSTDDTVPVIERLYCLKNNITSRPICRVCHEKPVPFDTVKNVYKKWCSISCSCKDPETQEKLRKTKLERYGNPTYHNQEGATKTRLEKYGQFHAHDFGEKLRQTKLERYGDEHYVNTEKCKQTKLERYGSETYNNQEKERQTKLERYGDKHYNNRVQFKKTLSEFSDEKREQILVKRAETCFEKYGVDHVSKLDDVKEKHRQTCLEKYGVDNPLKLESTREDGRRVLKQKSWSHIEDDTEFDHFFTWEDFLANRDPHKKWTWRCKTCGTVFDAEWNNGHHHRCYVCHPNCVKGTSLMEQEIYEYVKRIYPGKVFNHLPDNKRIIPHREIDIWLPEKKFGIEFNGLYYHSESKLENPSYHLEKTLACEEIGAKLVHIFEDEWTYRQKQVKAFLRHQLGCDIGKIDATDCLVDDNLDADAAEDFLDRNDIKGSIQASHRLGLMYNGHLVAVAVLNKPRFNKQYDFELLRYAEKAGLSIYGGLNRLFSWFKECQQPKTMIAHLDRRFYDGRTLKKIGFKFVKQTQPKYSYVKDGERYSRTSFQKHMLKEKLASFDPEKSEIQNMLANGYDRVFDCGSMVYEWRNNL